MVEFHKSIFNFGGFKTGNQDPSESAHQPQPDHNLLLYQQEDKTNTNMNNLFPTNLLKQTSTPAIAVADSAFAYGTTTISAPGENFLTKTAGFKGNLSQQHQQYQQQQLQSDDQPLATDDATVAGSDPVLTNILDNTQTEADSIPRGKLRVTIVEATGLVSSPTRRSSPYVVCTFESSEFISHGPESVGTTTNGVGPMDMNSRRNPRPIYQRQSSSQHLISKHPDFNPVNPTWHHQTIFDVVGAKSELYISVYDSESDDAFLGYVGIVPQTIEDNSFNEQWYDLKSRVPGERVTGKIKVKCEYFSTTKRHYGPLDFEVLRLLGKGTFGQVFQVRKKDTKRIYAMKVLSKKVIVKKKEIAHTIGERDILVRTSAGGSSFIVGLKFSFQTPQDLYLVTDYMSGGELFWHLQKEGRFQEDRAKFYIAELVLALEHLHDNDIVYRDLKPENILLDANGHIALCDFGLSKANLSSNGTTNTFCGTTEYLAPEVLLDETGYTKMVDFWSLGVLIFEMCCGWSPFYAENTQQMYKNIAFGKVRFPKEVLSAEGRSFVKRLLNRNPKHRLGAENDARELREHPFFNDIDWDLLRDKKIPPPFKPHLSSETDTSNFDPEFTNASTSIITKQFHLASTPLSPGIQANFNGFTYVDESTMFDNFSSGAQGSTNPRSVKNPYKVSESLVLMDPNLPPEEEVIDVHDSDNDGMDIDYEDQDQPQNDYEFVNGQFDL